MDSGWCVHVELHVYLQTVVILNYMTIPHYHKCFKLLILCAKFNITNYITNNWTNSNILPAVSTATKTLPSFLIVCKIVAVNIVNTRVSSHGYLSPTWYPVTLNNLVSHQSVSNQHRKHHFHKDPEKKNWKFCIGLTNYYLVWA